VGWAGRESGVEHDRTQWSDDALVAAVVAGDFAAFNLLVERYQRLVYAVTRRVVHDAALAEDATQEAFIRAYRALDRYRGGNFRAWLLRIAANCAIDIVRAQRQQPTQSLDAMPVEPTGATPLAETAHPDPERVVDQVSLHSLLEAALAQLSPEQRLLVTLIDIEGLSYEEASDIAGIPVGTVKSRLSRARAALRSWLCADPARRELLTAYVRSLQQKEATAEPEQS